MDSSHWMNHYGRVRGIASYTQHCTSDGGYQSTLTSACVLCGPKVAGPIVCTEWSRVNIWLHIVWNFYWLLIVVVFIMLSIYTPNCLLSIKLLHHTFYNFKSFWTSNVYVSLKLNKYVWISEFSPPTYLYLSFSRNIYVRLTGSTSWVQIALVPF